MTETATAERNVRPRYSHLPGARARSAHVRRNRRISSMARAWETIKSLLATRRQVPLGDVVEALNSRGIPAPSGNEWTWDSLARAWDQATKTDGFPPRPRASRGPNRRPYVCNAGDTRHIDQLRVGLHDVLRSDRETDVAEISEDA